MPMPEVVLSRTYNVTTILDHGCHPPHHALLMRGSLSSQATRSNRPGVCTASIPLCRSALAKAQRRAGTAGRRTISVGIGYRHLPVGRRPFCRFNIPSDEALSQAHSCSDRYGDCEVAKNSQRHGEEQQETVGWPCAKMLSPTMRFAHRPGSYQQQCSQCWHGQISG